ncbi:MAG: surface-adhesin E family protein [Syntrophaceae bacterium]
MHNRRFFSKCYIVLFACLLMLPCYSKDVIAAEGIQYFKGKDGVSFFYDIRSIQYLPENSIRVLIKIIPGDEESRLREITIMRKSDPTVSDKWSSETNLWEINCQNRTQKLITFTEYDKKNKVIRSKTSNNPTFHYIMPESMMEALYIKVCSKKNLKKKRR